MKGRVIKPIERHHSAPRLVVPLPEEAKTDEDYFRTVAEPFYMARLVESYRPRCIVRGAANLAFVLLFFVLL